VIKLVVFKFVVDSACLSFVARQKEKDSLCCVFSSIHSYFRMVCAVL
jgi:hypothetical protein